MSEVQLLEKSTDVAIMKRVQQELPQLKRDSENAEFWIGGDSEKELLDAIKVIE